MNDLIENDQGKRRRRRRGTKTTETTTTHLYYMLNIGYSYAKYVIHFLFMETWLVGVGREIFSVPRGESNPTLLLIATVANYDA